MGVAFSCLVSCFAALCYAGLHRLATLFNLFYQFIHGRVTEQAVALGGVVAVTALELLD